MPSSRAHKADTHPGAHDAAPPQQRDEHGVVVVAIGTSSGGLDACRRLVAAIPARSGMAFILIQHLDPTHESMMVPLLAGHAAMTVRQAEEGSEILPDNLYAIPPGTTLTIREGRLHLAKPGKPRGTRMPFDELLASLAEECGPRAIAVVLTGTGRDGSKGVAAVKQHGGYIIAQDPADAEFDGMPRSAIETGCVDQVLPISRVAEALMARRDILTTAGPAQERSSGTLGLLMPKVLAVVQDATGHDFSLYKYGTLQRRIERRMAMAGIPVDAPDRYLAFLGKDEAERERLASDLLIHVTGFFRDPHVFALLAESVIPTLVREAGPDRVLRIWVAGCSTGEEAYSLAIIFREAIAGSGETIRLQIFGTDVDPEAVATAREGLYPATIAGDVSQGRLDTFFRRENDGYRVGPDLRGDIVFAVQDMLTDPPFSRLDMISCRNVLIYLLPDAQAKVLATCHFSLRKGGALLLGGSETIPDGDRRFAVVAKQERVFRHIVSGRASELVRQAGIDGSRRLPARLAAGMAPSRLNGLAEFCRRLIVDRYAPASLLINHQRECLYSLGPIDRYLRVAPGHPSNDILAMARRGLSLKLRSAMDQVREEKRRVIVPGGWLGHDGGPTSFRIDVQPTEFDGEALLLVSFVEDTPSKPRQDGAAAEPDTARLSALESELEATRAALDDAVRDLEVSAQEQKAINDEALSVTEEFQSTNEELLASKEEMQSLNEELVALNTQLHETLEQQRGASTDLQNVLYSTDVATMFLDPAFRIRLFTPATTDLFSIIRSDIGRPITDLRSLTADHELVEDGRAVLAGAKPIEREVTVEGGRWFLRRIMPYRGQEDRIEGVVVTFNDITERKRTAKALAEAQRQAEAANAAKSRFLAAASHDLRQPLQTLALIRGLLGRTVMGEPERELLARLDQTLDAMSGMLNTLLGLNQIEAGAVQAAPVDFQVGALMGRLCDEFAYAAHAQGLALRTVPCSLMVRSDPQLLEQMLRNLLSNALKYTPRGKVLVGCRRHRGMVSVEIWDTGDGIHASELQAIFEEYYQVGGTARDASRGLGLGLSIVQRLANLLGHRVSVRSWPGKGSMFAVAVPWADLGAAPAPRLPVPPARGAPVPNRRTARILVVEDDPELLTLLAEALAGEGHAVITATDGEKAAEAIASAGAPDLVLADYNLPGARTGLGVVAAVRARFGIALPALILTGDTATRTLRDIAAGRALQLSKPVQLGVLAEAVQRLLHAVPLASGGPHEPARHDPAHETGGRPLVLVIDDDANIRDGLRLMLEGAGFTVACYATAEEFLDAAQPRQDACLLVDVVLPGLSGLGLLHRLHDQGVVLPTVMITGQGDVAMAVEAMRAGAADFIEKPVNRAVLLAAISHAMEQGRDVRQQRVAAERAAQQLAALTPRQRQIMDLVLAGAPSKNIAADLGISRRTVENHRAAIMRKTEATSLPALARLAVAAALLHPA
jgi:two-component system CheB/CheR fusion protein